MLGIVFKSSIAFVISFVVLSFHVDNRPIFYHLSELTGPLGEEVQASLGKSMKRSITRSKKMGKNFLSNSDPRSYMNDSINSARSSLRGKNEKELILEDIRRDEIKKLDALIQSNQKR